MCEMRINLHPTSLEHFRVVFHVKERGVFDIPAAQPPGDLTLCVLEDVSGYLERHWVASKVQKILGLLESYSIWYRENYPHVDEPPVAFTRELEAFKAMFRADSVTAPRYWTFQEFLALYEGDILLDICRKGPEVWANEALEHSPQMVLRYLDLLEGAAMLLNRILSGRITPPGDMDREDARRFLARIHQRMEAQEPRDRSAW